MNQQMKTLFKMTIPSPSLCRILFAVLSGLVLVEKTTAQPAADSASPANQLWYSKPAAQWIEALPVGNGRLGAMVFGGTASERLALNDITVWSGGPQPDANKPDGHTHLEEIRKTIREGHYDQAEKLCNQFLTCKANYNENKYQALGDLEFAFRLPIGEVEGYRRWLDIGRALAGVEFKVGDAAFRREVFSSAPDKALVQRITGSTPRSVSFDLKLSRSEKAQTRFVAPNTLVMTGSTGSSLQYEVHARVLAKGGTVKGEGDKLIVEGADEVVVLLTSTLR